MILSGGITQHTTGNRRNGISLSTIAKAWGLGMSHLASPFAAMQSTCRLLGFYISFVERLHGPLTLWQSNMAMENLRTEWRFLARKITDFNGPFSSKPCLITGGYFWTHSCG